MKADLDEAVALLNLEAMLLDEQDWDAWLALYEEDAEIWMPAWKSETETTADPMKELSMIYYAGCSGLEDRVQRIRSGKSVKNAASSTFTWALRYASATRSRSSSRHCCTIRSRERSSGGSSAIAGGTKSANARAPWLPPNTSNRMAPSAVNSG